MNAPTAKGAVDFLRSHDTMSALWPTAARMAALQEDCAAVLPDMFEACAVLQFEADSLVFSTPNSALAAKLRQMLPKLQQTLSRRGWQVNSIRIKVQVDAPALPQPEAAPRKHISESGFEALAALQDSIEDSPRNTALKSALHRLLARRTASSR
jgi:Dna[CI] antecedent, DciA